MGTGTGDRVAGSGRLFRSSPRMLTHRAGFVCAAGPCRAARAGAKHGARLTGRVPPTAPGPQRKWQFSATWRAKRQLHGVLFRVFPRSHPHKESRRGEADRARMACFTWASGFPRPHHSLTVLPGSASVHTCCPLPRMRSPSAFF